MIRSITLKYSLLSLWALSSLLPLAARADAPDPTLSPMRSFIEHESADLSVLERRYDLPASDAFHERLRRFFDRELAEMETINFDTLDPGGKADYLLLHDKLVYQSKQLEHQRKQLGEVVDLLPFADSVLQLEEARRLVRPIDAERSAGTLNDIYARLSTERTGLEEKLKAGPPTLHERVLANRAADLVDRLRDVLHQWDGIPGHCLQGFMAQRYNVHRQEFATPFYVEGWALYWEMRMWDMGFGRSPEERVGRLFWRAHRCARIIFSLKFHLGQMSAQQAIDFLADRVGHERRNATAEVRRSANGTYATPSASGLT